ncbi:Holliday junction ATP-dependent DNA helicase RuvB, partial [Clarias magur]
SPKIPAAAGRWQRKVMIRPLRPLRLEQFTMWRLLGRAECVQWQRQERQQRITV